MQSKYQQIGVRARDKTWVLKACSLRHTRRVSKGMPRGLVMRRDGRRFIHYMPLKLTRKNIILLHFTWNSDIVAQPPPDFHCHNFCQFTFSLFGGMVRDLVVSLHRHTQMPYWVRQIINDLTKLCVSSYLTTSETLYINWFHGWNHLP